MSEEKIEKTTVETITDELLEEVSGGQVDYDYTDNRRSYGGAVNPVEPMVDGQFVGNRPPWRSGAIDPMSTPPGGQFTDNHGKLGGPAIDF